MITVEDIQEANVYDDEVKDVVSDMHDDVDERIESGDLTEDQGIEEHTSIDDAESEYWK